MVDYLGTTNITLLNRTEETAINLAKELNLKFAPYSALQNEIATADVILVSTGAMEPVILKGHLNNIEIGAKLIIDLSVPRNVAVDVNTVEGITLVDVDQLAKIKDETLQKRQLEVPRVEAIINEHIAEFMSWYNMRKYVPVIQEVKDKLKDIYIAPALCNFNGMEVEKATEETLKKVMNTFAAKMRNNNTVGCCYIEAINDYIEINGQNN